MAHIYHTLKKFPDAVHSFAYFITLTLSIFLTFRSEHMANSKNFDMVLRRFQELLRSWAMIAATKVDKIYATLLRDLLNLLARCGLSLLVPLDDNMLKYISSIQRVILCYYCVKVPEADQVRPTNTAPP